MTHQPAGPARPAGPTTSPATGAAGEDRAVGRADPPHAPGVRLGIIAARWHHDMVDQMISRATAAGHAADAEIIGRPVRVAGAGELPYAALLLSHTTRYDALVAIAVVIRGGTPHFDTVVQRATTGLLHVSLTEPIPIADAVLAVHDRDQAIDRIGGPQSTEDKGWDAAVAALELALLHRDVFTDPGTDRRTTGPAIEP